MPTEWSASLITGTEYSSRVFLDWDGTLTGEKGRAIGSVSSNGESLSLFHYRPVTETAGPNGSTIKSGGEIDRRGAGYVTPSADKRRGAPAIRRQAYRRYAPRPRHCHHQHNSARRRDLRATRMDIANRRAAARHRVRGWA